MQRHIESPGMTRAMIRTVALIATTCLPTAGWACADPVPANVPHQMVGEMLGWIEINTDYDMASIAAPAIQFCATDTYITAADGIVAECGGACACATCHSYIDEAWLDKIPAMDDMEDSMLDAAYERKDNSRLTCQLEVSDELDGLVVHVAENDV